MKEGFYVRFPEHYVFIFTGYDNYYETIMPQLERILCRVLEDKEEHFLIAISEAVCNAACYATAGPEQAKIQIQLVISDGDVKATVQSDTQPFDFEHFRKDLRALAEDPLTAGMEWGDYTSDSPQSRGYWIMLMACDYITVDVSGKSVMLCARTPFHSCHIRKTIRNLVPRLYLNRNGVIF